MSTTRECGCPPWVKPCVHFDGRVVYVVVPFRGNSYEVHGPTRITVKSNDADVRRHEPCDPTYFQDGAGVDAEFDRRAAQLVGHE